MMPLAMTQAKYPGSNVASALGTMAAGSGGSGASAGGAPGGTLAVGHWSRRDGSVPDTDPSPSSAARARLVRSSCQPAAVDDIRSPQVPDRIAPGMHEAAEGPDGEHCPCGGGMHLIDERGVGDGDDVGVAVEQASEPQRHALAVVVAATEESDPHRLSDAEHDHDG